MKKTFVLYNPLAGDQSGKAGAEKLSQYFSETQMEYRDIRTIVDYSAFAREIGSEDAIVIYGGDGTLNRFVNGIYDLKLQNEIFYYAAGSGNDFLRDIGASVEDGPVQINTYIQNLPSVTVNGQVYRFLNGVGYGIDGYCCEVGDAQRQQGKKPNYTAIAITGLLFHYNATNATVTVDGKKYNYKRVWIAPTMHGRYYGGGMMAAPDQDRTAPENGETVVIMHKAGRLGTLCIFPSIFEGKHIKHTKKVGVHTGHEITVEFDRPVTLQIDGETILDVSKYQVTSSVLVKK